EQHGAQEVVAAVPPAIETRGHTVQKPADLLLRPGKRALIDRSLDEEGIAEELPNLHRRGDKLVHTAALRSGPRHSQPAIHNMNCSAGAIKTSYLPSAMVCASPSLPVKPCMRRSPSSV